MREPEIDCIESRCQNRKHEASHLHDIGNGTEFAAWKEDIKRWEITVIVRVSHSTETISLESNRHNYEKLEHYFSVSVRARYNITSKGKAFNKI